MFSPPSASQPAYQHNGRLVAAEAFYRVACDPRRSVAVEACAGAGKTWMLVSRIVRALFDSVDPQSRQLRVLPQEILAITFTKKAASEMRQRLYKWLAEFATADRQTLINELRVRGVLIDDQAEPVTALPQQLSNLYQSILATGREVQIRTFHSWFAAVLRAAPLAVLQQMGLPTSYELLEDDAKAKSQVWRRFYAALLINSEAHISAKADFEAVVFEYGRFQTEKALATALDKRTEFALADEHGIVDQSVRRFGDQYPEFAGLDGPDDFLSTQSSRREALQVAAKVLSRANATTFSTKGAELELALNNGDLSGVFDALLTKQGTARKFSENMVGIELIREAQNLLLKVQAARAQQAAWNYQQRMARLCRVLLAEYAALKRERGWVDMNDVERAALIMLNNPVLSGWVQQCLDVRVRHLLIDEFQDTNPLQWQALRSWLSGYAGVGGHVPSVFIVGDPKQSVYRFRRAEPQVFKAAKTFVCEGLGGDLLSCDHTRRNASAVINAVNVAMTEACETSSYGDFRWHTTSSPDSGAVLKLPSIPRAVRDVPVARGGDLEFIGTSWRDSLSTPREVAEETLRAMEARQAARWISQQLKGLQAADVMVLSRKRSSLLPMHDELRKLQIAAQIGEKTDLIDYCEVMDIVALLDVLVSPQHDLSLARVLKSPIFDLDDKALETLALEQRQSLVPWFDLLEKVGLETPDRRSVHSSLQRWQGWLNKWPPHDALQAIYSDGDVLARFVAAVPASQRDAVQVNLRSLLSIALQVDGGRYLTAYALVRALKSGGVLAPATVNPQAVRLLTIHGAKGLEAETVLLLDTDAPERNADTMTVLVDWPGEAAWPQKFVFLASETQPPACSVATLEAEYGERQREELNTLYVALTRARKTLAISSIEPYRTNRQSWWQRLAGLSGDATFDSQPTPVLSSTALKGNAADVIHLKELPSLLADGSQFTAKNRAGQLEWYGEPDSLSARIGKAMHRLLEWGNASNHSGAAVAREFALTPAQGAEAAAMANRILQGEAAWVWDKAVVSWWGNEVELLYQGQILRLDRLVRRKDAGHIGEWWVLDFKSAAAPQLKPELVAQLDGYRIAVQSIYPNAAVKAAFLTAQGVLIELKSSA